jgi:RHS repeat-associated protein
MSYDKDSSVREVPYRALLARARARTAHPEGVYTGFLPVQNAPILDQYVSMTDYSAQAPATYYYSQDERSSVRALTGAAGAIANAYTYTAMGETVDTLTSETVAQRYQYTGRELNPYSGLFFFRYRTYGPEILAFLQRDPFGYVDGLSVYNGWFALGFGGDPSGTQSVQGVNGTCLLLNGVFVNCPSNAKIRSSGGSHCYRSTIQNSRPIAVNGCGPEGGVIAGIDLIPDGPPGMGSIFISPCNLHDRCYGTCGATKSTCDTRLFQNAARVCRTVYRRNPMRYAACLRVAQMYFEAVRDHGANVFESAQDDACEWVGCCMSRN